MPKFVPEINNIKMKKRDIQSKLKKSIFIFLVGIASVFAQDAKVITSESKVTVDGTSNIHDWTIEAKTMNGAVNYTKEAGELKSINKLDFYVDVNQLKSGKKGMDENTVKALDGKINKTIAFKLTKVLKITKTDENTFTVDAQGNLTVKGKTKLINQTFTVKLVGNKIIFSGKQKIDMTTFGVEPPKALLGSIKTGKDVTVNFKVTYN